MTSNAREIKVALDPGGSYREPDSAVSISIAFIRLSFLLCSVSEMPPILSRRDFERALKDIAHRIHVSEAAFVSDCLHAVVAFLQPTARRFDAEALNKFCRRSLDFFDKDTRKIARAHGDVSRQHRNRERFVQIIEHP